MFVLDYNNLNETDYDIVTNVLDKYCVPYKKKARYNYVNDCTSYGLIAELDTEKEINGKIPAEFILDKIRESIRSYYSTKAIANQLEKSWDKEAYIKPNKEKENQASDAIKQAVKKSRLRRRFSLFRIMSNIEDSFLESILDTVRVIVNAIIKRAEQKRKNMELKKAGK